MSNQVQIPCESKALRQKDNAKTQGKVRITGACIACGSCTMVCSSEAIKEGDIYSVDKALCGGCAKCVQVCPMDACVIEEVTQPPSSGE
jgi:ferredoxin